MDNQEPMQGTEEWHSARLGKVTASRIADVLARTKTGWGATRKNYAADLVAERLTGQKAETFKSAAMDHGNEMEDQARRMYEFMRSTATEEVGFVNHPSIEMTGASPDRLIGDDGLLEIKCPNTATHIETLQGGSIKGVYLKQMQWQMECTGRQWCDFVSFDPRLPAEMQLHVTRVERDAAWITETKLIVVEFLSEIEKTHQELRAKFPAPKAA